MPAGAAVRRAKVAVGLLTGESKIDPTKLDVALEILRSVGSHREVGTLIGDAFDDARDAKGHAAEALALALDAVGSDRAPAALLEAYGSAKTPMSEVREAIGRYDRDALRAQQDAVAALSKRRREELGLS